MAADDIDFWLYGAMLSFLAESDEILPPTDDRHELDCGHKAEENDHGGTLTGL